MKGFPIIITIVTVLTLAMGGVSYAIFAKPFLRAPPLPEVAPSETVPAEDISPTPVPASAQPPSSPPESPLPEPPAQGLEGKVTDFRQAVQDVISSGESQEVTLIFTEAEINDQAAKILTQTEIPEDIPLEVNSIHIDLQPDNNLLTEAKTTILGLGVTLKAGSQVSIRDGKPEVTVADVSFGFIPLPGVVKDKIVAFITQKTDDLLVQSTKATVGGDGIDLEFKEINIQEEKVTITVLIKKVA